MKKRSKVTGFVVTAVIAMVVATAYAAIVGSKKEGLVEYVGAQKDIFVSGKASSVVSLKDLAGPVLAGSRADFQREGGVPALPSRVD